MSGHKPRLRLMKAYEMDGSATLEGIAVRERDMPRPGPREILVRMRAASLNFRDLMTADGRYSIKGKGGVVPLSDGAGEVIEVGSGVTRVKAGERVTSTFFPRWISGPVSAHAVSDLPSTTRDGVLAEYVVFHEDSVVAIPSHLSYEEASTLPCAALTAWVALNGPRPLLSGETVLTQGSGGVSIFALQIAKLFGARVIVTTSDAGKGERLTQLGADEVVNYRDNPEWFAAVKELTAQQGADHIIEIGGAGTLEKSIRAAAIGGVINMIGVLEKVERVDPSIFMRGIVTIRRISVGSRAHFESMNRAIALHKLRPVIDRVFPFSEAISALRYFAGRGHFGKVVIALS